MHAGHFRRQHLNLQGRRVLIVEDEALVAMMFEDVLLDAGAKVIGSASSVEEALLLIETAATNGGLNAAVLDINLQGAMVSPVADHLAALDMPPAEATKLLRGRQWREGDVALLQATAARLGVQVPGL